MTAKKATAVQQKKKRKTDSDKRVTTDSTKPRPGTALGEFMEPIIKLHEKKRDQIRAKGRGRQGKRTKEMVDIAKERIRLLLEKAEHEAIITHRSERSNRYVRLARKLAMRYNIRIQNYYRHKICRVCNSFIGTSAQGRVRCRGGKVVVFCKNCGSLRRVPMRLK